MKIGILGGTFDPPHNGHLAIARAALAQLGLDEVIFMPANHNPIKGRRESASAADRLKMVEAMVRGEGDERLALSDMEITRGGPSYTVDTLAEMQFVRPADYWFLLGADSLKTLNDWKQPHRILRLCRLGVVTRPAMGAGFIAIPEEVKDRVDVIEMEASPLSSRAIRDQLAQRRDVHASLPSEVIKYIQKHKLYLS